MAKKARTVEEIKEKYSIGTKVILKKHVVNIQFGEHYASKLATREIEGHLEYLKDGVNLGVFLVIDKPSNRRDVALYAPEDLFTIDEAKAYLDEQYQDFVEKIFKGI